MQRTISFAAHHPLSVLALLLALTLGAVSQLDRLSIHISAQSMMLEGDPERLALEQARAQFGSSNSIAVVISSPELWQPQRLEQVRALQEALAALPFVEQVDSLFTVKESLDEEGVILFRPYLDAIPQSAEAVAERQQAALANPFVADNLLSRDGQSMALNLRLPDRLSVEDGEISAAIERLLAPQRGDFTELFAVGLPQVRAGISEHLLMDQRTLLPLSLATLILVMALTLRRLRSAVVPLFTAGLSVIWSMGLMAALGVPLGVMTSIVPALLVVVGSTEDIHLLSAYQVALAQGQPRPQAIRQMGEHTGLAILLTFVTTYLGFLSIALNDISLLREFGLIASTGLLFNFVITLLALPAMVSLWGACEAGSEASLRGSGYRRLADWIYLHVVRYRRGVIVVTLLIIAISLYGASRLEVNNDLLDYFPEEAPIKRDAEFLHQELAGMQSFAVILDGEIEGTFLKVRYLQELQRLQLFLDESGLFDKSLSFADFVGLLHHVFEGYELIAGEPLGLPEEDAILNDYMLFIDSEDFRPYASEDLSQTRIWVRHNISSSKALKQAVEQIEAFVAAEIDPGLHVSITGEAILNKRAADRMAAGQAESLAFMVAVIFMIVSLLFLDPRAGALAVVPNVIPIVILFGVMGFVGIPLNTGTAMVAAIAIGICVDDTMHVLVRFNKEMGHHPHASDAVRATLREEARPIMSTTLALGAGFLVMGLSSFPPVVHFGLLSALVILLALLANFVITPVLLTWVPLVTAWELMGLQLRTRLRESCPLFTGMNEWQLRKLILISRVSEFEQGSVLARRGERGESLFVILEGELCVELSDHSESDDTSRVRLGVGEVVGEVAVVGSGVRTGTISAAEHTRVLQFEREDLEQLRRFLPRCSAQLFRNLAYILGQRISSMSGMGVEDKVSRGDSSL